MSALGPFQHLIGTWTNRNLHGTGKGGPESPYSYNIMPLPQEKSDNYPCGYIIELNIGGTAYQFPHITCNTLTKVEG